MLPLLLAVLSLPASAEPGDPNGQRTFYFAVVHATDRDHPWGVRVGASLQLAIGDHCGYGERDCRQGNGPVGSLWPVIAPAAAVEWRGSDRLALSIAGEGGIASVEMAPIGFTPFWQVMGRVGARWELAEHAAGLALGGYVDKSLSPRFYTLRRYKSIGTDAWGLRIGATTTWIGGDSWIPWTVATGFRVTPGLKGTLYY